MTTMNPVETAISSYRAATLDLPPEHQLAIGDGDYREIGIEFLRHLIAHAGLQPDQRILDIGCGLGRIAQPLRYYLEPESRYVGFDVVEGLIEWCQTHIAQQDPRFMFMHLDLRHPLYNPAGSKAIPDLARIIPSKAFDLAIMTSVLTHLDDVMTAQYLSLIAGWLKPQGRLFATAYLLDDSMRDSLAGHARFPFDTSARQPCHHGRDTPPFAITALDMTWLHDEVPRHGLHLEKLVRGRWFDEANSEPTQPYQDIIVLRQAAD